MAARAELPSQTEGDCTMTVVSRSGNTVRFKYTCTGPRSAFAHADGCGEAHGLVQKSADAQILEQSKGCHQHACAITTDRTAAAAGLQSDTEILPDLRAVIIHHG